MNNTYLLKFPMKSINNLIKVKLVEYYNEFQFEPIGINFENNYYDFRVSKATIDFELIENEELFLDKNIHINQITTEEICLCIIFKSYFKIFILNYNFLSIFQNKMTYQHNKNCFQLHIPYREIKLHCQYNKIIVI